MELKWNNIFANYLSMIGVKHTESFSEQYFNEHPHKYNLFGLTFSFLINFSDFSLHFLIRYIIFVRLFYKLGRSVTTGYFRLHRPQCFIRAVE